MCNQSKFVQDFLPTLKDHLLGQLTETPDDGFTDQDRRQLVIYNNRIFCHKTLRINFTTYDCRRDQDVINTSTRSDVMVLADQDADPESIHPYWYGRVIGIFHALVRRMSGTMAYERMDFLWVRWYGLEPHVRWGFKARRLLKIGFFNSDTDADTFGFVNPCDVIRAVHLIPAFNLGKTSRLLSHSIARRSEEGDEDYECYNVNMYIYTLISPYQSANEGQVRGSGHDLTLLWLGTGSHSNVGDIESV